jgi:hypothetical protein
MYLASLKQTTCTVSLLIGCADCIAKTSGPATCNNVEIRRARVRRTSMTTSLCDRTGQLHSYG